MIGALSGVLIQWLMENLSRFFTNRRKASCDLKENAFIALDRLSKINVAHRKRARKILNDEIYRLGPDLDRWRDCIARAPGKNGKHWQLYKRIRDEILLSHNLSNIQTLVGELESITGVHR